MNVLVTGGTGLIGSHISEAVHTRRGIETWQQVDDRLLRVLKTGSPSQSKLTLVQWL